MKILYLILSSLLILCIFYMWLINERCTSLFGITIGMVEEHPYCYYPAVYDFNSLVYYLSPISIINLCFAIYVNND